jgi:hypothetical protein
MRALQRRAAMKISANYVGNRDPQGAFDEDALADELIYGSTTRAIAPSALAA